MANQSFFQLTTSRVADDPENLLADLTPDEFETYYAEASTLSDVLLEAIAAYAAEHDLSMMAAWIAADIVRFSIAREIREDEADA